MQNPIVTIQTTQGTLKVELYPEVAPNTVNNLSLIPHLTLPTKRIV